MLYFIIILTAFAASLLTFFSGFGLGTILFPAFALFFPLEVAVALTGVVHFLTNIFKTGLIGKNIDKNILLRFGIPAIVGAIVGASLLSQFPDNQVITTWGDHYQITFLRIIVATLMVFFALFEIIPFLKNLAFEKNWLSVGGLLSGFFGGLSGHQGALRSAFLIRYGLKKETLIATGVAIACLIDLTRLSLYYQRFLGSALQAEWKLIAAATLSAFIGAYFGNKLLKKVTIDAIQKIVAIALIVMALCIGTGLI